jgi:hypothetical protein
VLSHSGVFSFRTSSRSPRRRSRRRGVSTIELVAVLVVLILATFVSLQFGIALIVKQAVAHAATVAAREAAKANPADREELQVCIERVLAPHRIKMGKHASFVIENPSPQPRVGQLPCQPPAEPALDSDEVRVTVCVSLTAHPILNILADYGIDFTGKSFRISATAARE